jgi:NAD(P)H-dependent FMN reductase
MMKVQVILVSIRPGRLGERVANWVASEAKKHEGFEVELLDLADFNLPHFNEAASPRFAKDRQPEADVARWLSKVDQADAYIVVTPEYNHSYPGVLKDAIDFVDFQFVKKPFAIVSYGTVGGARAAEQLKLVLIEAKAAVVPEALALLNAASQLSEDGQYLADPAATYGPDKVLGTVLTQLSWWSETLKAGRIKRAKV